MGARREGGKSVATTVDARRHFGLTADDFLRIFRNRPEQYHVDVRSRSLCHVADLTAEPEDL